AGDIIFVGRVINRNMVTIANAIVNSTLLAFFSELIGRTDLGDGLLTTYGPELLSFSLPNPYLFDKNQNLLLNFECLCKREVKGIQEEVKQPDRRALDDVIFDVLGLTKGEREAVYEAVIDLVTKRLQKARSGRRSGYAEARYNRQSE
ncbi:MAG: hypothetical protein N2234_03215, partial [Planctomycetota bacterium]|nr:hypothetical protein [Planctomycetota bacterium]